MLVFVFAGFLVGFLLSLRLTRRYKRALILGLLLGSIPLLLMLGPGTIPIKGIGSVLFFAIFAFGPLMIIPFLASSAALGAAGGAAVLWIGEGRARWVRWAASLVLFGFVGALTLLPVAQREVAKRQFAEENNIRAEAIIRADFKGTLAGHQVAFPASPRLYLFHTCRPGYIGRPGYLGCTTGLLNPVSTFTEREDKLLNERSDPIDFRSISVSTVNPDCNFGRCLTQEKVDHWCSKIRPDQKSSIWCRDMPSMQFSMRTEAKAAAGPSDREEPELAARYAETPLGPGRVNCFYHPDPAETDQQGVSCTLTFNVADGVKALLSLYRAQITSGDPEVAETIAQIPDYWAALTVGQ